MMEQNLGGNLRWRWTKRDIWGCPIELEAMRMLLSQYKEGGASDYNTSKTVVEGSRISDRKNKAPRMAAEAIGSWDSLPYDVQFNILLRISAYDIPRLRLVCKSMRNLLSSDNFIYAHLDYHRFHLTTQIRFLVFTLVRYRSDSYDIESFYHDAAFNLDDNGRATLVHFRKLALLPPSVASVGSDHGCNDIVVLSSCNGLVLVSPNSRKTYTWDKLFVSNPVTGVAVPLPSLPPLPSQTTRGPSHSYKYEMLGYDDLSNEYKVAILRVHAFKEPDRGLLPIKNHQDQPRIVLSFRRKFQIMITSVRSSCSSVSHHDAFCSDWRVLEVAADFGRPEFKVATNGRLNWFCTSTPAGATPSACLLSLDLRQEIVQETLYLPLPEISEINAVFESHGSLYCMFFGKSRTGKLEIWAMKDWESPNHWTKEITVSLDTYYKFAMPYAPVVQPLGMTVDANRLILSVQQHQQMLTEECKLVTLDLRSKELKDIICGGEDDPELGSEAEETFCIKSWPDESVQYFIGSLVKLAN